jgi:glycosyltransferase involved in cell wall biosynthesis
MKKKCLIISHVPLDSVYGAGTSLWTFLEKQDFLEVDLVLPIFIASLRKIPRLLRNAYKIKPKSVSKIFFLPLPFMLCYEGSRPISAKASISYFLNDILAVLFLPIVNKLMKNNSYSFIYFNSIVLNPLVSCEMKCILHIREIIDKKFIGLDKVINNLSKAAGLIFIDKSTYDSYQNVVGGSLIPLTRIINNPFSMENARRLRNDKNTICNKLKFTHTPAKIFSYIGMIHPIKGVDRIIKAFIDVDLDDAHLLVVGSGERNYIEYCRSLASNYIGNKIFFMGLLNKYEVSEIYAISDYIIRADPDFRIGRTTYEALYAGACVIIPGDENNLAGDPELKVFSPRIILYNPLNNNELADAMRSAYSRNIEPISSDFPVGNISHYCNEFKFFLEKCLNE